jgi:excisionase family DNA binding protein
VSLSIACVHGSTAKIQETTRYTVQYPFRWSSNAVPEKAAEYINVSIDVMYEMIHKHQIPYIQKGKGKRPVYSIDRCDLDVWIERDKIGVNVAA